MERNKEGYKFFAFISYRHTDVKAAKKLQSLLESYNLPTEIKEQVPDAPKKFKVFRDVDELTAGILSEELQKKLRESRFLIVICSPNSAESKYVGEEIAYFRELGREREIIPFIIDGVPHAAGNDCFHPQLCLGGLEILGIDVQTEKGWCKSLRFHRAFIRTVARMLGLDFDILWNKRKRQFIRRTIYASILSVIVIAAIVFFALKAHNEQPFDTTLTINEAGIKTSLPLSDDRRDSVFIYLEDDDVRRSVMTSLHEEIPFKNIPGKYKNKPIRIVSEAFGCQRLDTVVDFSENVTIDIRRNPETFGRIRHYVKEENGETPAIGAVFDFGFLQATTDSNGLLDVLIPLEHQKERLYPVTITYKGKERFVQGQRELDPLWDSTETYPIILDK